MHPSRRGLVLGLLLCVTAVAFESQAVATAMPAAAADLGQVELYAWAFTAVLIPQIVAAVVTGRLSDVLGPARPLAVGLVVFAFGVVVAALAPTMPVLLVGRFIQGLGGGAVNLGLMVVTATAFPPQERAAVMTWYSAAWVLPSLAGPAIAAWLSERWSWHWVFWAVLPLVAVGAALVVPHLRGRSAVSHDPDEAAPVGTSAALAVALGIALLQVAGQRLDPVSPWLALLGLVLLGGWLRGLMPVGFLGIRRGLDAVVTVRLLTAGAFFGTQAFLPLMLVTQHGVELIAAGAVLSVASCGWFAGSWLQSRPWLPLRRDQIVIAGAALVALGLGVCVAAAALPGAALVLAASGFTLAGAGMGLQNASTALAVMILSARPQLGRNTSALQVAEMIGMSVLAGLAGTIFNAVTDAGGVRFVWINLAMLVVALTSVLAATRIGAVHDPVETPASPH